MKLNFDWGDEVKFHNKDHFLLRLKGKLKDMVKAQSKLGISVVCPPDLRDNELCVKHRASIFTDYPDPLSQVPL